MGHRDGTPAQAVVDALVAEGVEYVFGLVGSHVLDIYDALLDARQIRCLSAMHENSATCMAGMYGRLTGKPAVVLVTAGPGALNSLSGVAQAYQVGAPLVHLSGTVPTTSGVAEFHGTDRPDFLVRLFAEITKWSVRVERPEQIPGVLACAFRRAVEGRPGPVHVEIPFDVLRQRGTRMPAYVRETPEQPRVDERRVLAIARRLTGARCPVLCAGSGVLIRRVTKEVRALAERLRIPVIVSGDAVGAFPEDHPQFAGTMVAYRLPGGVARWLQRSDCAVMLGLRAGSRDAATLQALAGERALWVNLEDTPGQGGLSRAWLEAALHEVGEAHDPDHRELLQDLAGARAAFSRKLADWLAPYQASVPIHFGVAMARLARVVDRRAIVVTGTGNHREWARWWLPVQHPFSQVPEGLWGTMGWEVAGAVAAKLVHPDRLVVAVTGDGSLLMAASDLATVAHCGANILVVVMNDARYGMIEQEQRERFGRAIGVGLPRVNLTAMAESAGWVGLRVEQPEELDQIFQQAIEAVRERSVLVEVVAGATYPCPDILALAEGSQGWSTRMGLRRVVERVQGVLRR